VRSSTSFDFPAIDTRGNGSWVVGTAGGSALVPCTPTLMSQATSVGTGPAGAVKDTNQSIVGWRDTICTVATSATWKPRSIIEIVNTGSGPLRRSLIGVGL